MTSNIKFNRKIKASFNNGKFIEGLRMTFRVERVVFDAYAKLKLEIYNMNFKHGEQNSLFERGDNVILEAGYANNVSVMFSGLINNVQSVRNGVDDIVTVFASDNVVGLDLINVSYSAQTSLVSLLSDLAFEAGVDIAEISIKPQNILGKLSYSKKFGNIMNDLARTYKFTWFIYNGELYLYDDVKANSAKTILQINASTGLLESPILTQKGIDVKMLLESSVKPMDIYEVKSGGLQFSQGNLEFVDVITQGNGLQKVLSVIHSGDTHGAAWYTEIEGIKVI